MTKLIPKDFCNTLLQQKKNALINFLGNEKKALRFVSSALHCIQMNPKLTLCDQDSLMGAFLECASIDLFPSTWAGECYIIPYGNKAQFQMGYKGFITLGYRNGVSSIWSEIVYENDKFEEKKGTNPKLIHEPATSNRGEPIAVYACAKIKKDVIFKVMTKEEIMKIKKISKSNTTGPWANEAQDPERWMWRKTCIKQLAKMFPKDDGGGIERAMYLDNVSERGGYIKKENEIVEADWNSLNSKYNEEQTIDVLSLIEQIKSAKTKEELEKIKENDIPPAIQASSPEEKKQILEAYQSKLLEHTKLSKKTAKKKEDDFFSEEEKLKIEKNDLEQALKTCTVEKDEKRLKARIKEIEDIFSKEKPKEDIKFFD